MTDNAHPIDQLQQRFAIPEAIHFDTGQGGLARARLEGAAARAEVYLHGGHVCAYQPRAAELAGDLLYMSERSAFAPGEPIRGGIPVCFPWFGNHGEPQHGPVRLQPWQVTDTAAPDGHPAVELTTQSAPFRITCRIVAGPALELTARVENLGDAAAPFELALHTYFAVGDAQRIAIQGLDGRDYLDKTQEMNRFTQEGPIHIDREVDRVYEHAPQTCTLHDPVLGRAIAVEKTNLPSTIVWNPWQAKAARLADLPDDAWQRFVCIESGSVHAQRVTLAPGAAHESAVRITAQPLTSA